jgi:hypothetical protein
MEQILFYGWLFLVLVVNTIDGLSAWLNEQGLPPWLVVLWIVVLFGFHIADKWTIQLAGRVEAIEKKLGIKYTPPVKKRLPWWKLLAWFMFAVYLLGKSLQGEGLVALGGVVLSGFMLLVCAFCTYCFIDQAIRDSWRKKRERREWLDNILNNEKDC